MQTLSKKITLNCKGRLVVWDKPVVMGIINTTPDSFFAESRQQSTDAVLKQAEMMLKTGASILDIGGYSSRPGAHDVAEQEETDRVVPAIEQIHKAFPEALISIDTFRAKVAKAAIEAGACMVNDISAGDDDEDMVKVLASLQVPYILMHKQGKPQTMQHLPQYANVVLEVMDYLRKRVQICREAGIKDLIIDPGFGFGKDLQHNYQLFSSLADFQVFGLPILVGVSRKSMIQKLLHVDTAHALNGTTVLHTLALTKGAAILRVHDVAEAMECIQIVEAVNGAI